MTDAVTPAPSLPDLPSGRFSGREAFMQLVRDGVPQRRVTDGQRLL